MKIALLTNFIAVDGFQNSGIGQHVKLLADSLDGLGHDVIVIVIVSSEQIAAHQNAIEMCHPTWSYEFISCTPPSWLSFIGRWDFKQLASHITGAFRAALRVRSLSRARMIEIIETHSYYVPALFLPLLCSRIPCVTRVATLQSQIIEDFRTHAIFLKIEAWLERTLIKSGKNLITHTACHRAFLCEELKISSSKIHLISLAVPDVSANSALHSNVSVAVNFLFVGRFEYRKGIDVLLRAIPKVLETVPNAHFVFVGGDILDPIWVDFLNSAPKSVVSSVDAKGCVGASALEDLYRCCDVLVAPSRYESFGLIYAEAMSYGKPTVGCRVGGAQEIILDRQTGLLCAAGDSDDLAFCMIELALDDGLRTALGQRGRQIYEQSFHPSRLAKASIEYYSCVIST